jgi:PTH1 family peptidyl-tRNA hydrolase
VVQEEIKFAVIGLGNPGKPYLHSRHNIGFLVLDYLSKRFEMGKDRIECVAITKTAQVSCEISVLLVKPATFMNSSGKAVGPLMQLYTLSPQQILVIHDDMDLPFLQLRFKSRGQSGGHRGIDSIIQTLHTDRFARMKIGIGRPDAYEDPVEYVLSSFTKIERDQLQERMPLFLDAVESWIMHGFHVTANRFNRKSVENNE